YLGLDIKHLKKLQIYLQVKLDVFFRPFSLHLYQVTHNDQNQVSQQSDIRILHIRFGLENVSFLLQPFLDNSYINNQKRLILILHPLAIPVCQCVSNGYTDAYSQKMNVLMLAVMMFYAWMEGRVL